MRINSIQTTYFTSKNTLTKRCKTAPAVDSVNPNLTQEQVNKLYDCLNLSRILRDHMDKIQGANMTAAKSSLSTLQVYIKNLNYGLERLVDSVEGKKQIND